MPLAPVHAMSLNVINNADLWVCSISSGSPTVSYNASALRAISYVVDLTVRHTADL